MAVSAKDLEADAKIERLKLDMVILGQEHYDDEVTNTVDRELWPGVAAVKKHWHRDKNALGNGQYGIVYREFGKMGDEKSVTQDVRVVKIIRKDILSTTGNLSTKQPKIEQWKRELRALMHFSQLNYEDMGLFVFFRGWYEETHSISLVFEWLELGDLESYLTKREADRKENEDIEERNAGEDRRARNVKQRPKRKDRKDRLPEKEAAEIAVQITRGLEAMHAANFAHRDLKPAVRPLFENILVKTGSPKWSIKLTDFGFSKEVTRSILQTTAGTQGYMAPEITGEGEGNNAESSQYTLLVDIWSAGCVIYRLLKGKVPTKVTSEKKFMADVLGFLEETLSTREPSPEDLTEPLSEWVSERCISTLGKMLQQDPRKRISATQALRTSWLAGPAETYKAATHRNRRGTYLARGVHTAEREAARRVVKGFLPVNPNPNGQTPTHDALHMATLRGSLKLVQALLKLGVDANCTTMDANGQEKTAMTSLAGVADDVPNWQSLMDELYEGGCDVNALSKCVDHTGVTPLFAACSHGFKDCVCWLLCHGARNSVGIACTGGLFPLHAAAKENDPDQPEIISMLIEAGATIDLTAKEHPENPTALHLAVAHGQTHNVQRLVHFGADMNRRTAATSRTPLHIAVTGMAPANVDFSGSSARRPFQGYKPDPTVSDLLIGGDIGNIGVLQVLLEAAEKIDLFSEDSEKMTALHYAAKKLLYGHAIALIEAAERTQRTTGLQAKCGDKSAYTMAWEAGFAKKPAVTHVADQLEPYASESERAERKNGIRRNRFALPNRHKDGSSSASSSRGSWWGKPGSGKETRRGRANT